MKMHKRFSFGTAPNTLLNNPAISFRAKGVYTYMESKPDGWDFSAERIAKNGKEGRDAVYASLNELEEHKYLKRIRTRKPNGNWDWDYEIYDQPYGIESEEPENPPSPENPSTAKPSLENQCINKESSIKKESEIIDTNVSIIQAEPVGTEISTEIVEPETYGNKDMNEFLSYIQKVVEDKGYLYRKGNQERNRAWNILKSKEVCAAAEKNGVSSAKFAIILLIYSFQSKIYAGKVTNAESLWYKWDKLYNEYNQISNNSGPAII